ncbi:MULTISPECIES: ABC transporter ATP-binding protein [Paenibacillus]|uniref:ABC transporter ATP-binding protein n=1 Tax=Paenibacillus polymyxa TaxID=1406 RepID=A0AAJ3IXP4_PAEPO|nr:MULTISPECIES: ABC transporter ATP-binding protein [Paenibacillus]AIW42501.1 peptide ABC transporter ATP-binding protein [Paenibacillus polymyxa CR1]ALA44888.1 peptide ABC transporter ATP-binding protein [Paenibacillus peoriae]MBP1177552.1 peptide/nickel transport system ATP-binding protein [Paenibacillus sp. PvR133]MCP3743828.1 ABC transporter ATP-binding protein [Paenibacillus sp. A3M_27_13]MDH2333792.1 ABC transporter ATP-binding protein [Paenibacillus polymyxa]
MAQLLEVTNLRTEFKTAAGTIRAVDGVDLSVGKGETLGIVGESGCGKSITSLSIMQLLPKGLGKVAAGEVRFNGENMLDFSERKMRSIRGNEMAMIFQEPMTSLNPVFKIGKQIAESARYHHGVSKHKAKDMAVDMLTKVGIPRPEKVAASYPHELSGGMRQRVMIAMAMVCNPKLLIADEPTTALDVTIQAQILDLMRELQKSEGTSILMITHDLGVVAEMCDRVVIMYAGQVVEETDVKTLFKEPKHPYTQSLLASLPQLNSDQERLASIPGQVPNPLDMPHGCRFAPRCQFAKEICRAEAPELTEVEPGHKSRCLLQQEGYHEYTA